MTQNIEIGSNYSQSIIVELQHTAKKLGSGNLDVFATPAMIAFMENTALKLVEKYIPQGYDTVGTDINAQHIKASKIGEELLFTAHVSELTDKKIIFNITALNSDNQIIGKALHTRFIIDVQKFISKL